jgi:sugar/nucleoside kinase (ribokinase family)
MMKKHHINTDGLQVLKDQKTFFWAGKYHNDMNSRDTITTELNVLETFDPVVPEAYQDCDFLMLGNLMPKVQQKVMSQLKKRPKLIVLDTMNFWMDIAMPELLETLKSIDVLTINDAEARQLSGEYSLVKAAQKILAMGPKYLIIKKGEHGALLFDNKQVFFAPALPLEDVFDPTGAGDSFAGGFMGYLAATGANDEAAFRRGIIYGSVMASFNVEEFGCERMRRLNHEEINSRFRELRAYTNFEEAEMPPF